MEPPRLHSVPFLENWPAMKKKFFWAFAIIFAAGIVCWPLFR